MHEGTQLTGQAWDSMKGLGDKMGTIYKGAWFRISGVRIEGVGKSCAQLPVLMLFQNKRLACQISSRCNRLLPVVASGFEALQARSLPDPHPAAARCQWCDTNHHGSKFSVQVGALHPGDHQQTTS